MASVSVAPNAGVREPSGNNVAVDRLPEEMNDMKIRDDKVDFYVSVYCPTCHSFGLTVSLIVAVSALNTGDGSNCCRR